MSYQREDKTVTHSANQFTIKRNTEYIHKLRQENKRLYKQLSAAKAGDESVVKRAFHNKGLEKEAFCNLSGKAAFSTQERKVLSKKKRVNAQKHMTHSKKLPLEKLHREYQRMKAEASSELQSADIRTRKKERDIMKFLKLENNLEKTLLKCKEAENIMINYQKVKSYLQEEGLTFHSRLDSLEAEILKHREELQNMKTTNNIAKISKETAMNELQRHEELCYKEQKEREHIIASYRKKAEEQKAQTEKVERQRTVMQSDEMSSEEEHSIPTLTVEEATSTFQEVFRYIKEATGATDLQEIEECYILQKETYRHLLKLKEENEKRLQHLQEQKELLIQKFQDMKYSGEDELSGHQHALEEHKEQLQAQQQRYNSNEECLDQLVKALFPVQVGVKPLTEKLQHLTLTEDTLAEVDADSDQFLLLLVSEFEQKLLLLQRDVQKYDLSTIIKEMAEEEFCARIEEKLPAYNIRIKLPEDLFSDEEESEKEDIGIITREVLKHQAQLIVDTKSKKNKDRF